ncbi:MAG: hypothetical protein ACI4XW_12695 [Candidatus Spyradocola sp.]
MSPAELWWNCVPAGIAVRDGIVKQIASRKCVLLDASHLPWKDELMGNVQNRVAQYDTELNWNVIDAQENVGHRPLSCLGRYFGVDQVPVDNMILQRLRLLHSCCWVHSIPEGDAQAWIRMAKELFGGREKSDFSLVLELPAASERSIGKIAAIGTEVERFDVYYFALSLLAEGKLCKSLREYAATLCAELAGGDAELCCALCRDMDAVLREPLSASVAAGEEVHRKQLVCRAQTRSISPLIDIGRLKLISIFRKRIEAILPQRDDYGNVLEDVNDVELRHLVHLSNQGLLPLAPNERNSLHCLYEARNEISHLNPLSFGKIQELLGVLDRLA